MAIIMGSVPATAAARAWPPAGRDHSAMALALVLLDRVVYITPPFRTELARDVPWSLLNSE